MSAKKTKFKTFRNMRVVSILVVSMIVFSFGTYFTLKAHSASKNVDQAPVQLTLTQLTADDLLKQLDNDFVIGEPDAPITLIEYSSFSCGHCAEFNNKIIPKFQHYIDGGKLKIIHRSFPMNFFDVAATLMVQCVDNSLYDKLKHKFFEKQDNWLNGDNKPDIEDAALKVVLELYFPDMVNFSCINNVSMCPEDVKKTVKKLRSCFDSEPMKDSILQNRRLTYETLDIFFAPMFFVNKEAIKGLIPAEDFISKFEKILNNQE